MTAGSPAVTLGTMSRSHPTTAAGFRAPRHAATVDARYVTARRWAVGVLAVATAALGAWLVVLHLGMLLVLRFVEVFLPGSGATPGVLPLVVDALPGLLAGWCTGFAALAVLVRAEAPGPRACGVAAGALGAVVGAAVLGLGPVL